MRRITQGVIQRLVRADIDGSDRHGQALHALYGTAIGQVLLILIGQVTLAFKDLAVSLGIPVVLLAQVSREVEKESRVPRLSDLRESGNIEQDADRVLFIHLPQENSEGQPQTVNDQHLTTLEVELVQAKGRDNGCASVKMAFHRPTTKFHQLAKR